MFDVRYSGFSNENHDYLGFFMRENMCGTTYHIEGKLICFRLILYSIGMSYNGYGYVLKNGKQLLFSRNRILEYVSIFYHFSFLAP